MVDQLQNLLELQADAITDFPVRIPFVIDDSSMLPGDYEIMENDGVKSTELVISPLKVGTVLRIHPLISKIKKEDLEAISVTPERPFDESASEVMDRYSDLIVEIICIGIHNKKSAFPVYMPEFIKENCTWKDLHLILNAITFRMGTMAFTDSTTELMRVGPGAAEMIALQKNLESWEKKKN